MIKFLLKYKRLIRLKIAVLVVGFTFFALTSEKSPQNDKLTLKQATDKRLYWEKRCQDNAYRIMQQETK